MNRNSSNKFEFRNSIFKNSDEYNKESYYEKLKGLRNLTLEKSAKIVEELVTCQLGKEIIEANKKWSKK